MVIKFRRDVPAPSGQSLNIDNEFFVQVRGTFLRPVLFGQSLPWELQCYPLMILKHVHNVKIMLRLINSIPTLRFFISGVLPSSQKRPYWLVLALYCPLTKKKPKTNILLYLAFESLRHKGGGSPQLVYYHTPQGRHPNSTAIANLAQG